MFKMRWGRIKPSTSLLRSGSVGRCVGRYGKGGPFLLGWWSWTRLFPIPIIKILYKYCAAKKY